MYDSLITSVGNRQVRVVQEEQISCISYQSFQVQKFKLPFHKFTS
jgi:hypothetical protein